MTKSKNKIVSSQILDLIRIKHPAPEWAVFGEMRSQTGFGNERYLDAWCMNTWKGKRFRTIAYEVKVTRADFEREIENPTKRERAEELAGECFFAVPAGLVAADEVPEGWGLVVVQSNGLVVKKKARQRKVKQWPTNFIAMIARRSADITPQREAKYIIAGAEVQLEELKGVVEHHAAYLLRDERQKIHDAAYEDGKMDCDKSARFGEYVAKKLCITQNSYSFDRWFARLTQHGISEDDKQMLERARLSLTNLLDKLDEQAKPEPELESSAAE